MTRLVIIEGIKRWLKSCAALRFRSLPLSNRTDGITTHPRCARQGRTSDIDSLTVGRTGGTGLLFGRFDQR